MLRIELERQISDLFAVVTNLALLALAIILVALLVVRGSEATRITENQFDDALDHLDAFGSADATDRQQEWRAFQVWLANNELPRVDGADEDALLAFRTIQERPY